MPQIRLTNMSAGGWDVEIKREGRWMPPDRGFYDGGTRERAERLLAKLMANDPTLELMPIDDFVATAWGREPGAE